MRTHCGSDDTSTVAVIRVRQGRREDQSEAAAARIRVRQDHLEHQRFLRTENSQQDCLPHLAVHAVGIVPLLALLKAPSIAVIAEKALQATLL